MQSNRDRIKEMIEHISTFNDADPGEGISRSLCMNPSL